MKKQAACLPGTILLVYLGEQNKPVYPLLLRTDANDSTFMKFAGGGREKFYAYGFDILSDLEYFNASVINAEVYAALKNYIVSHNTRKNLNFNNAGQYALKIILQDRDDFVMYSIDETNKEYLSGLIDIPALRGADDLIEYFRYYHRHQY